MPKLVFLSLFFLLFSCGRKNLTVIDYLNYYKNPTNGLSAKQIVGDYTLEATLKSRDYMALVNLNEGALTVNQEQLNVAREQVENFTYIILTISWDKKTQNSLSEEDINYYTNEFMKDLYLNAGSEKILCKVSNLESTMNPQERRLIVGFPNEIESLKAPLSLSINSKKISNTELNIAFANFNSKNLPNLKAE